MTLDDEIRDVHTAITKWERETFYLGSPFSHCAKLASFVPAGGELEAALGAGTVRIHMPSEYHAPRYVRNVRDEEGA